eukprot:evm.model.scf_236.1 EVM.evm.TU.scf_236.1   scf_236:38641-41961(-)
MAPHPAAIGAPRPACTPNPCARPCPALIAPRLPSRGPGRQRLCGAAAAPADAQASEGSFSGEWPMNWSLASYEDMGGYYERQVLKEEGMGGYCLRDVMSTEIMSVKPYMTLLEIAPLFEKHTGLPVLDEENRLVGVISRRDFENRAGETVEDAMSTPPIAAKASNRVADAACLMLKHKIHRIPVVDKQAKVIGIVTRTDIFTALEAEVSMQSS